MYDFLKPIEDGLPMRQSGVWAKAKLDYVNRYIAVFETSMRQKWERRNYIDIFAGPGKNQVRDTNEVLLGSPLLALTTQHPFTGYYFIDKDSSNTAALEARAMASGLGDQVKIRTGDSNNLVDWIVGDLSKAPSQALNLAFLDPEGLELHWQTVARLASVWKMDLIINYPRSGLTRNMEQYSKADEDTPVDRFFGGREWRDVLRESNRGLWQRHLLDLYKSKLAALGYQEIRNSDELGDEPLMRNEKQATLYHLIFASKNTLGHKFWKDITKRDVFGQRRLFDSF